MAKSRSGLVPGNLICYKDRVISQGSDGLETFYQLGSALDEADRRLAAGADDAGALTLRGEVLFEQGKHAEAAECLRHAYQLNQDPATRDLLREVLLDGLQTDFADLSRPDGRDRSPARPTRPEGGLLAPDGCRHAAGGPVVGRGRTTA